MTLNEIPDAQHIYLLRERLHTLGPSGRAAVMVGAGFSRNARRRTEGAASFPLWTQMAEALYRGLNPALTDSRAVELAAANGGMLQLAQEYQATHGRAALDDLIRSSIPDSDHDPSDLHRDLLRLPWADVFTTNYDTLLERAARDIHKRRYDIVITRDDLPSASSPRIVKLHGSLPSQRPFVFTEEDYRRYPRESAPFVNTVRQSLMENTLVLLGFSGDDPNFLAWLGWVRDELASASPPVLLCGVLNLSPGRRAMLTERGVTPVDLAPIVRNLPNPHEAAARWILRSLSNGEPPNGLWWPSDLDEDEPPSNDGPRPLPRPPGPGSEPSPDRKLSEESPTAKEDLRSVTIEWAKTRSVYPGWIWTPRSNRSTLRSSTEPWRRQLDQIVEQADDLTSIDRLRFFSEFVWRLDRTYSVPTQELFRTLNRVIEEHDTSELPPVDFEAWARIAIYLFRDAARTEPTSVFEKVDEYLACLTDTQSQAVRCYEHAARCLGRLDLPGAEEWLAKWPEGSGAAWELRRAALLVEIGRRPEAKTIAEGVLDRARMSHPRAGLAPYRVPSVEGAAQYLLDIIDVSDERWFRQWPRRDREDQLTAVRCAPRDEIAALEPFIDASPPGLKPSRSRVIHPDGSVSTTYYWGRALDYDLYQHPRDYLGVFADAAIPLHFGGAFGSTMRAAEWVADLTPSYALDILVRTLHEKHLTNYLDRLRVAAMPSEEVDERAHGAKASLKRSLDAVRAVSRRQLFEPQDRSRAELETATILLAALAFRLSKSELTNLLDVVLTAYATPIPTLNSAELRPLETLLFRTLDALDDEGLGVLLPKVAELPLSTEHLSDPFQQFPISRARLRVERDVIEQWIRAAKGSDGKRSSALLRLLRLYSGGVLSREQSLAFEDAVWSSVGKDGLPDSSPIRIWYLLALPRGDERAELVKEALLARSHALAETGGIGGGSWFTPDDLARIVSSSNPAEENVPGVHGARITSEDALKALDAYERWTHTREERGDLDPKRNGMGLGMYAEVANRIPNVIRRFIVPHVDFERHRDAIKRSIALTKNLGRLGVATRSTLPAFLAVDAVTKELVALEVRRGLGAVEPDESSDAAKALYILSVVPNSEVPHSLFDELGDLILRRRPGHLLTSLGWARRIVRDATSSVPQSFIERLADALELVLDETGVPTYDERLAAISDDDRLILLRRPDIREECASLAKTLSVSLESLVLDEPFLRRLRSIIERWEKASSGSVFPSVRRAFRLDEGSTRR